MPLAGAGLLLWVAYKAAIALTSTERWILIGLAVLGVTMLFVAA